MRKLLALLLGLGLSVAAYPQQQIINTGAAPNSGTGDTLQVWATKDNANFTQLFSVFGNGVLPNPIPNCPSPNALNWTTSSSTWGCTIVPSTAANNTWTGTNAFHAAVTMSSTLAVSGVSTLGTVNLGSLADSGNATISGTLGVSGNTTIAGTLTAQNGLTVTGTSSIPGYLPTSGGTMTGNLSMGANTLFLNTISSASGSTPVAMPNVTTSGTLTVSGGITSQSGNTVLGNGTTQVVMGGGPNCNFQHGVGISNCVSGLGAGGEFSITRWNEGGNPGLLQIGSSTNGAIGGGTPFPSGNQLGRIDFVGDAGTANTAVTGATIASVATSTFSGTNAQSNLVFAVSGSGSVTPTNELTISTSGSTIGETTNNPTFTFAGTGIVQFNGATQTVGTTHNEGGYPVVLNTTAPTLVQTTGGSYQVNNATMTVTVPQLSAGTQIDFFVAGTTTTTFTAGSGVTLYLYTGNTTSTGNRTLIGAGVAHLMWINTTSVAIWGQGVT